MLAGLVTSPTLDLGSPLALGRQLVTSPRKQSTGPSHVRTSSKSVDLNASRDLNTVARAAVAQEYANLRYGQHCPLGMYVTPASDNLFIWDAVLFVHRGYYMDSILKFRLTFPTDYPERPPVVQFMTDVFHPLISQQDGSFNLSHKFRPWRPKEHHAYDILHVIKASFKKQALDEIKEHDCLNKEAYRQYHDSTSSFSGLATQSSMLSQTASALFDSDHPSLAKKGPPHNLQFRQLKPEKLDALRKQLGLRDWSAE